jgi:hypothetical protein
MAFDRVKCRNGSGHMGATTFKRMTINGKTFIKKKLTEAVFLVMCDPSMNEL